MLLKLIFFLPEFEPFSANCEAVLIQAQCAYGRPALAFSKNMVQIYYQIKTQ